MWQQAQRWVWRCRPHWAPLSCWPTPARTSLVPSSSPGWVHFFLLTCCLLAPLISRVGALLFSCMLLARCFASCCLLSTKVPLVQLMVLKLAPGSCRVPAGLHHVLSGIDGATTSFVHLHVVPSIVCSSISSEHIPPICPAPAGLHLQVERELGLPAAGDVCVAPAGRGPHVPPPPPAVGPGPKALVSCWVWLSVHCLFFPASVVLMRFLHAPARLPW